MADDIFISYARVEREKTLELAGQLWDLGYTTWIDAKLPSGELFREIIDAAVDQAGAVLTIWSRPALKSQWVNYESNRGKRQNKLICTHTQEVDPGVDFSGDFHGLHSEPVSNVTAIVNRLVDLGVRPKGVGEEELPAEAVLERQALREWKGGISQSFDIAEIEDFIARFKRARLVAEVAERRLLVAKARATAEGDRERERVFRLFEALEGGSDPEDLAYFLKKHFAGFPELAMPAAERLQELDPERFLAFTEETPGVGDRLADVIDHAHRLIRLRDTPPEAAILRLDPGMHTAAITRISVTADGALMASASLDKTVKLWSLPELELVRTLRPPIGEGNEGKVYAVAMDPAGRWVAAGGWDKDGENWVRIFDLDTGAVRARLGPLPNVVFDLEVSPNGACLAAGLFGSNGIRLWQSASWQALGQNSDYGASVYGLAFTGAGHLATTSYDGHVRLHERSGGLLKKARAPGGSQPYGIAASQDGARLAVGYSDSVGVDLLDAASLEHLNSADTSGLSGGDLSSVSWTGGAEPSLVAGGRAGGGRTERLFTWTEARRGARKAWPGPRNTIMDLASLPGGGLTLASAEPSLSLYNADGKRIRHRLPDIASLAGKLREHFTVSEDGLRLRFGLDYESGTPVLFDLVALTLSDAPAPGPGLSPPRTVGLEFDGWENTFAPSLTRKPGLLSKSETVKLNLPRRERARSLAIAPDAQSFLLGAEHSLYRFDAAGEQLWRYAAPEVCWGVNLAREGRLALAAYGDGTIRWHRAEDGAELLALFIHLPQGPKDAAPEDRDWILWTPEGYYTASSERAEDLIGWHVNRGPDEAADFYPAETFAETFRRPDKVAAALDGV
ncbi:MAG: TIR domain-containing protein [Pseudomonadota bacterium]